MARKLFLLAALVFVVFFITGCQTIQGLGGDIKWTGERCAEMLDSH